LRFCWPVRRTLPGVPLETALEILLAGTPYVVKKTPNYYLVASREITDGAFPEISETRYVRLNYMPAETAVRMLSPAFAKYVKAEGASDPNSLGFSDSERAPLARAAGGLSPSPHRRRWPTVSWRT